MKNRHDTEGTTTLLLYNLLWGMGLFPIMLWLMMSAAVSRKRRFTVLHRLGIAAASEIAPRHLLNSHPVWVHALSVGETLSAAPLVRAFKCRCPGRPVIFSASTLTGFETARRLLKDDVDAVIYFPYDLISSVRSAIKRIRPCLMVIVETDIWPNFLFEMKKRAIPVILINARMSDRSFSGYRRLRHSMAPIFRCFSGVGAQTCKDADRFHSLGISAACITVTGNLKYDQLPDAALSNTISRLEKTLIIPTGRKCIVAGSTHPGEETILLSVFSRLKTAIPEVFLILAPRDIERAESICDMAASRGLRAACLTRMPQADFPDVVVVNTIGQLGALYAFSVVAFVGGSLMDFGGHNPLEPAALGKPVLFGPYVSDVSESCEKLLTAGGARMVASEAELHDAVYFLMTSPDSAAAMGKNALQVVLDNQGALENALQLISAHMKSQISSAELEA
jgi:3-deoxy-D-manno-octulosonic-acid transferase